MGRSPWTAAGPLAGLGGTRASRADEGVRPTNGNTSAGFAGRVGELLFFARGGGLLPADFAPPVDLPWPEYVTTARGYEWVLPAMANVGERLA